MTTEAPPAAAEAPPTPTLGDVIVEKLKESPHPLKLAEVLKALPKPPKGVKPAAYKEQVNAALAEGLRSGRAFSSPSGKSGEARFWGKDERYLLRERGLQLAGTPQALAKLQAALVKQVKGAEKGYVEGLLRDLIGDGYLHEHATKKGPLFGSSPPPPPTPPLELPANAKEFTKLVASVEKLLKKAGVDAETLFAALRQRLTAPAAVETPAADPAPEVPAVALGPSEDEVERQILEAVEREGTMSLKDLRRAMPSGGRGPLFDRAVLGLEDRGRVSLSRDYDSTHFSPEEQAEYVREGETLFTSIAKRS